MAKFVAGVASAGLLWFGSVALAQAPATAQPAPRSEAVAANSAGTLAGRVNLDTLATAMAPRANARVQGIVAPGLKVTLDGSESSGGRLWYRWIQTEGGRATIRNADQPAASVTVPTDGSTLGFVLVVGNNVGVDARVVAIAANEPAHTDEEPAELKAAAGPDQNVGLGRRVTLDGSASEPKGGVRYRWMQVDGPRAAIDATAGPICTFTPRAAGTYRFALLVVGANNLVSDASTVTVRARSTVLKTTDDGVLDHPVVAIDELARVAITSIPGARRYAAPLAQALDRVAERGDSYRSYGDAAAEMARHFDAVVPHETDHRTLWVEQFFKPWSDKLADTLRADGLDLTRPDGPTKALTKAQRTHLVEQLRISAAGLRAGTQVR